MLGHIHFCFQHAPEQNIFVCFCSKFFTMGIYFYESVWFVTCSAMELWWKGQWQGSVANSKIYMTSDLGGNWERFVGQFKLHVNNRNKLTYLHTHRHTFSNSVQTFYSSGYSAKYSLALTAAAINFSLVCITMATTKPRVCVCVFVRVRESVCGIGEALQVYLVYLCSCLHH